MVRLNHVRFRISEQEYVTNTQLHSDICQFVGLGFPTRSARVILVFFFQQCTGIRRSERSKRGAEEIKGMQVVVQGNATQKKVAEKQQVANVIRVRAPNLGDDISSVDNKGLKTQVLMQLLILFSQTEGSECVQNQCSNAQNFRLIKVYR